MSASDRYEILLCESCGRSSGSCADDYVDGHTGWVHMPDPLLCDECEARKELEVCQVGYLIEHVGKPWPEVIEDDPAFVRWLVSDDGPEDVSYELWEYLMDLLEET